MDAKKRDVHKELWELRERKIAMLGAIDHHNLQIKVQENILEHTRYREQVLCGELMEAEPNDKSADAPK